jgi:hypothetical protein
MQSTIEEKIEKFKTMTTYQNQNVVSFGMSIIEELVSLNSQLYSLADSVSKKNDELMKVGKDLKKEHKRIMKQVLKANK